MMSLNPFMHNIEKWSNIIDSTVLKMRFSMKDFFSKCDQIRRKLWIWSHLMKKSLMKNFIFCAVLKSQYNTTASEYVLQTMHLKQNASYFPANIYLFKVIGNTRKHLLSFNNKDTRIASLMLFWCLYC